MLDAVTKGYLALHPSEAARTLARIDKRDAATAFSAMPPQLAGKVMEQMAPISAAHCLMGLPPNVASDILTRLSLASASATLRVLDEDHLQRMLGLLPKPRAARIRVRLRLSEWVIGAFVEDNALTLSPQHRVGDALRLLRSSSQKTCQTLMVLDNARHLVGVVDLCELLSNPDRRQIGQLMRPSSYVLNARTALQSVVRHPAWVRHDSLPVINRNGIFQGVLYRSRILQEESRLMNEIAERNDLVTTRAALADILWLAVGALFISPSKRDKPDGKDD